MRWLPASLAISVACVGVSVLAVPLAQSPARAAQSAPASVKVWVGHYAEYEDFLRAAEIVRSQSPNAGITGGTTHVFFKPGGLADGGAVRNLRPGMKGGYFESFKSEVAAYVLDRMLQLDMVPPTVARTYQNQNVSIQLWVDNTRMWKQLQEQKISPPATTEMTRQFGRQKVFDDLVANIDENATNMLFDPAWNIIKIDHSRAFTNVITQPFEVGLAGAKGVARIDREFLDRLRKLDKASLNKEIGTYVEGGAVDAILRRRDFIIKGFEKLIAKSGEAQVYLP
jgi:hypothetical protein